MALKSGPMQVAHNFFSAESEVLRDIDRLNLWHLRGGELVREAALAGPEGQPPP